MFSDKKQGNYIYILTKSEKPSVRIGEVETVVPVTQYPIYTPNVPYASQPEPLVDIKVKCGDENVDLKKLPANGDCYAYPNNVFVFEKKEALISEVESMMQTSKQAIESKPYHESVITHCDLILKEVNPQFAKEKMQEEKIHSLEKEMSLMKSDLQDMKGGLGDIKSLLIEMNNKPKQTNSKN